MTFLLGLMWFGSGNGMGAPYWDQEFFWLVDTNREERRGRNGRLYTWISGFGAQLQSIEWRMPSPRTRRKLAGREFVVFQASRNWPLVRTSWALASGVKDAEEIRALKAHILEMRS